MDNIVKKLLDESRILSQQENSFPYERYENLVEIREAVTHIIAQRELSQLEKQYMQEIFTYESIILSHMQELRDQAMEGISRMNASKKQRVAYDQYQGLNESFMMDKKK